jgi:serine/threonine protein kinase
MDRSPDPRTRALPQSLKPSAPELTELASESHTQGGMLLALPTSAAPGAHLLLSRRGAKRTFLEDSAGGVPVSDTTALADVTIQLVGQPSTTADDDVDTEEDRMAQIDMRNTFFPSDSDDDAEEAEAGGLPVNDGDEEETMYDTRAAASALQPHPLSRASCNESEPGSVSSSFTLTVRSLPQLPAIRRDLAHLEVLPRIAGVGSTAKVYRAVHRESGVLVAVKVATSFFGREEQARFRQVGPHDGLVHLYEVIERGTGSGQQQQQQFGDLTALPSLSNSQPSSRRSSFSNVPLTPKVSQSPLFVSGAESPHAKRRKSVASAASATVTGAADDTPLTLGSRSSSLQSRHSQEEEESVAAAQLNNGILTTPVYYEDDPLANASHLLFHGAPPVARSAASAAAAFTGGAAVTSVSASVPDATWPDGALRMALHTPLGQVPSAATPSRPPLPPYMRSPNMGPQSSPGGSRRALFGGGGGPSSSGSPQASPGGLRRMLPSFGASQATASPHLSPSGFRCTLPSAGTSGTAASPPVSPFLSPRMSPSSQVRSLRVQHSPTQAPAASSMAFRLENVQQSPLLRGAMSPMSAFADRPISVQNKLPPHVRRQMAATADLRHSTEQGSTTAASHQRTTVYLVLESMMFSLADVLMLSQIRHRLISNVCIRHILRNVILTLQHLHSHGVVMVDVSPGNIMFTDTPVPVAPELVLSSKSIPASAFAAAAAPPFAVSPSFSAPPSPMTMTCRTLAATSLDQMPMSDDSLSSSATAICAPSGGGGGGGARFTITTAVTIEERELMGMAVKLVDLGGAIPLGEQPGCKWIEPNRRAPELAWISREQQAVTARSYEPSSDIWAVGILALEMVHRQLPLNLDRNACVTRDAIQHATWHVLHTGLPAHEHIYPELVPLIHRMLAFEPTERPTCAELLQSPFFAAGPDL